jgi:tRNA threonylcarbamoyladenosine biosynthesis protein TsaE
MEISTHSPEETKKLAIEVASRLKPGNVLALYGDLGSGKTTFTRFLVNALGLDARVQSPTFVVARKYSGNSLTLNHVDLYRLVSLEEVEGIGLGELIQDLGAITIIEWPEIAESLLPKETIRIYFKYIEENERSISIQNLY